MSVVPSASVRATLEEALRTFEANLKSAEPYLVGRGFTPETARRFRLGVVPEGDTKWYPGRLVIPYLTPAGVADLKFRSLTPVLDGEKEKSKYLYALGTEGRLFNAQALITPSRSYVVVEGELDAMSVEQAVGTPSVGYPGTGGFKDYFARAFYGCAEVIVVADGDAPGRDAAREVAGKIGKTADVVRIVDLPEGLDCNAILATQGAEALREVLA